MTCKLSLPIYLLKCFPIDEDIGPTRLILTLCPRPSLIGNIYFIVYKKQYNQPYECEMYAFVLYILQRNKIYSATIVRVTHKNAVIHLTNCITIQLQNNLWNCNPNCVDGQFKSRNDME